MRIKSRQIIGIILIILGILIFFKPSYNSVSKEYEAKKSILKFEQKTKIKKQKKKDSEYLAAVKYNENIYKTGQKNFRDAWSYEVVPVKAGIRDKVFGYIDIPKMNVKLPLYLGATEENMKKGATVLGQTSLPIGSSNSNSVIAGHRGYQGVAFFRDIEKLSIGDKIFIKNKWDKLVYKVVKTDVIYPDDIEAVKIQKGIDMITLITCHPYRTVGKYRYIVYCIRDNTREDIKVKATSHRKIIFKSSQRDIWFEKNIRYFLMVFILILIIILRGKAKIYEKKI